MKNIKFDIPKIIAYLAVPILALIIILNITSIAIYEYNPDNFENGYSGYENTDSFADEYYNNISKAIRIANNEWNQIEQTTSSIVVNENNGDIIEENNKYKEKYQQVYQMQYNFASIPKYDVLLVRKDGINITNVEKNSETDTPDKIKNYILSKEYFWKYDGKTIETSIPKLSYDHLLYNRLENVSGNNYEIYIALKSENNIYINKLVYDFVSGTYESAPVTIAICSILLMLACLYIAKTIGHKNGQEGIYTNAFDKIPYGIVLIIALILIGFEIGLSMLLVETASTMTKVMIHTSILAGVFVWFAMATTCMCVIVTTIRRIKAHIFWKNTFLYQFCKAAFGGVFTNLSQTAKVAIAYGVFILSSVIMAVIVINADFNPILILLLLAFWYFIFKKIIDYMNTLLKIRQKIKNMYAGNIDELLNEEELLGELKQVAKELNDISGGLSNAIEEATKSERLKTELITNVSHDIKTPLTSIINYVDLMKKEKIDNPKLKEYLDVLDTKSQRLKKLTEDLVEASKASSGNIKLNIEKLNVKELIQQVSGEFEDKFSKKGLQIIESFPEEEISIYADSRYMYRVMENMYMNISKYALENSRVYVDVIKEKNKVQILLKNISQEKLNISADELIQRFVRGDVSRTTEGSGLGISIAKSLIQLQKGKFEIYLDGDLFKVLIEFEIEE